jgi:cysteinyl-tRNA synthetase
LKVSEECKACLERLRASFRSSMSDDLLTPAVLASLSDPLKLMNDLMHTKKVRSNAKDIIL